MAIKMLTIPPKTLLETITAASTVLKPNNFDGFDGVELDSAAIGDELWCSIQDATGTILELMKLDPATAGDWDTTGISILKRGLKFDGDQTTEVAGNKLTWVKSVSIVNFGTNVPQIMTHFVKDVDNQTIAGVKTFTSSPIVPTPTNPLDVATKQYADNLVASGAPDASTVQKGIGRIAQSPNVTIGTTTITIASPAVVSFTSHGLTAGDSIIFTTTGALPTGLVASQTYYVISDSLTANTFRLSAIIGGTALNTSGSQSGTHTLIKITPVFVGDNDTRLPTQGENDALAGKSGTAPSSSNKYEDESDTSDIGSGSKLVRGTAGKIDLSWIPTIPFASIASGENLLAGSPVYVSPIDSTVYAAHGFKEISSVSYTHPSTITNNKIAKLSNVQYMALSNSGATLNITVFDATSGSTIASSAVTTTYAPGSTTLNAATMCRLSDTTFVVFYANTTNASLRFRTGSISGATITMDTDTAYSGAPDFCYGLDACPGASNGKVVFSYIDSTVANGSSGTYVNTLSYLTVATNSVTVTTTITFSITTGAFFPSAIWTTCAFTEGIAYGLFSCSDSGGQKNVRYSYINTIDSTTSAGIYTLNLESQTGSGVATSYSAILPHFVGHNGKCYFGWATNNGGAPYVNTKTVLEISQIGCKNVYEHTTVKLGGDTNVSTLPMYGNEMGVIIMGFTDSTSGAAYTGTIYLQRDKIYSFYNQSTTLGISSNFPAPLSWYSNLKDEIILAYSGSFVKTWRLPTPVDGLVQSAITSPAVAPIYDKYATTSGLTANAKYFLKDTYTTAGDMDIKGTIPVGRALSTTVLNLNN